MNELVEERICPIFTREAFHNLAEYRDIYCVSFFIPCETDEQTEFERMVVRCVQEVREELKRKGLEKHSIREHIREIHQVIEELEQVDIEGRGVAIFINKKHTSFYLLPMQPDPYTYVGDHFYLRPIAPVMNKNCHFLMLAISPKDARIFSVFKTEVVWLKTVHNSFAEKNKKEFPGKEMTEFLKSISAHVDSLLKKARSPLVLASSRELRENYMEVNGRELPIKGFIEYQPDHQESELEEKATELCLSICGNQLEKGIHEYLEKKEDISTSSDVKEIVPAAVKGEIEVLFINREHDIFGEYDSDNDFLFIDAAEARSSSSLTNIAAIHTVLNNGNVYFLDSHSMPDSDFPMNAILAS